jgi:phospholipid-transporting ATPase
VPKAFIEQFRKISNIYFLTVIPTDYLLSASYSLKIQVALIQLIPGLSPLLPITGFIPIIFILGVAMVKEAVEDYVSVSLLF